MKFKLNLDKLHEVIDMHDGKLVIKPDKIDERIPIEKVTVEFKDKYAKYMDFGRDAFLTIIGILVGMGIGIQLV